MYVVVEGVESNGKPLNFRYTPTIYNIYSNGLIIPGAPTTFWSTWIDGETVTSARGNEDMRTNKIRDELDAQNCIPLTVQVRNTVTGQVWDQDDLINGFVTGPLDCVCKGNVIYGVICQSEGDNAVGCVDNNEVRFLCGSNVIQFKTDNKDYQFSTYPNSISFKDIDPSEEFVLQPGLYDQYGARMAECKTYWDDGGSNRAIVGHHVWSKSHFRCQLEWSGAPRIGNYNFRYVSKRGFSYSEDYFMCMNGHAFNFQVRPVISSVSPAVGGSLGGTKITVAGQNLEGDVEIRVGGAVCNNVQVNTDGTEATCETAPALGECSAGAPADTVNCVTLSNAAQPWLIVGNFVGDGTARYTSSGRECQSDCMSPWGNRNAMCDGPTGVSEECFVPSCEDMAPRYPGTTGFEIKYYEMAGNQGSSWITYFSSPVQGDTSHLSLLATEESESSNFKLSASTGVHSNGVDNYIGVTEGFFRPYQTGYYSFVSIEADDTLTVKVSVQEQNTGCVSDLRTVITRKWTTTEKANKYGTPAQKFHLSADTQYFVKASFAEWGGGDDFKFGFVYHGTDADKNLVHGNTGRTARTEEHIENNYLKEVQSVFVKFTEPEKEIQEYDFLDADSTIDTSLPVFVYHCAAGDCTASDPIVINDNDATAAAVDTMRSAVCAVDGFADVEDGSYNAGEEALSGFALVEDVEPYCGTQTLELASGSTGTLFEGSVKSKKNPELCFASKGYADSITVSFDVNGVSGSESLSWLETSPNAWSFACVDTSALADNFAANNADAQAQIDAGENLFITKITITDSQARGSLYIDEIYVADATASFEVTQSQRATIPGTILVSVEANWNNDVLQLTLNGATDACGEIFDTLKIGNTPEDAVDMTTVSKMGAGLSGDFDLFYEGMSANIQAAWLVEGNTANIEDQIQQQFGGDFVGSSVSLEGECLTGYEMTINFADSGDYSDISINGANVNSDVAFAETSQHGGPVYTVINAANWARASSTPQVQVWASNIQAACTGNCEFIFDDSALPTVTAPAASVVVGETVTLDGSNFVGADLTVLVDGVPVATVVVDATQVTFTAPASAGSYNVAVLAASGASNAVALVVNGEITSVSPSSATSGSPVIISGKGLAEPIFIGGIEASCNSVTDVEATCAVLSVAAGATTVEVSGASAAFEIIARSAATCSFSSSASPSGTESIDFTCDSDIYVLVVDGINIPVSPASTVSFTPAANDIGSVSAAAVCFSGNWEGTLNYDASVTQVVNPAGSPFGGNTVVLQGSGFGSDVSAVSVMLGDNACDVTAVTNSEITCRAAASADFSLNASGSSTRTGAFEPASASVSAGTKVVIDWNIVLPSENGAAIVPTMQFTAVSDSVSLSLNAIEANQGSVFFVLTEPGTYTISSGPYDGLNTIVSSVVVTDDSGEVDIAVTVGQASLDLSTAVAIFDCGSETVSDGKYLLSAALGNFITDISVSGNLVSVSPAPTCGDIVVDGVFCSPSAGSCPVNVKAGTYMISAANLARQTSDDAFSSIFAATVTGVSPASGSKFGGTRVTIFGFNLLSDASTLGISGLVRSGDSCADNIESNTGTELVFTTCETQSDSTDITFSLDGSDVVTTFDTTTADAPSFAVVSASADGTVTGTLSGLSVADGTYSGIGMIGGDAGVCADVTIASGSGAVSCSFGALSGDVEGSFGISDVGLSSSVAFGVSPVLSSVSPNQGGLYGGVSVTVSGDGFDVGSVVSFVSGGVDLCAGGCAVSFDDNGDIVFVSPDSGVDVGPVTAAISVSNSGAASGDMTFSYLGALTPKLAAGSPFEPAAASLTIDMEKGVNPICDRNYVTIGGLELPVIDCSNVRATGQYVTVDMPDLMYGDYNVVVTNIDGGNSDGSHTYSHAFTVQAFSPSSSGVAGGAPLTISGTGFDAANAAVTICGTACPIASANANEIKCTIPAASAGSCVVELTDGVNTHTFTPQFTYDATLVAAVTGITASNPDGSPKLKLRGGTAGGTPLTITGSGFNANIATNLVTINGAECVVTAATGSEIICETGASSATGLFDVLVDVLGVGVFTNSDFQFYYVNAWSSPATWGCSTGTFADCEGAPKNTRDLVEIPSGVEILLDTSTAYLSVLLIRGSLIWDTEVDGIELNAEYIIIIDGVFQLGTEDEPMLKNAKITMYGHQRSIRLPIYGAKCFAARSGTVDIHGAPVSPTWTMLDVSANAGDNSITIQTPSGLTGWNVGNRIAIAPTGDKNSIVESEDHIITSITDNGDGTTTLGLQDPLAYLHLGVEFTTTRPDGRSVTLHQRAEVGLLSRNVKFEGSKNPSPWYDEIPVCENFDQLDLALTAQQNCFVDRFGDEEGSDKFGAHMLLHSVTHGKIEYMEVHHAGQAFDLGRYPVHFHNSYSQPNSYFRGLGIWQTFNRAMTMHAVNDATFEYNVAYNNMGHAFFTEDAVETGNYIQYNLAIKTKPSSSLLSVDQTPTSFWIVNTNNYVRGNHAAGSAGFGFWVNPPKRSTGSNVNKSYCPREVPVLEFSDNVAHSCGVYGMWIFEDYTPRKNNWAAECNSNAGQAGADHPMVNFHTWNNERGCELSMGDGVHMNDFVSANNFKAELSVKENHATDNFADDSTSYHNSVVIGTTKAHPSLPGCTSFGMETPWKFGSFMVHGIKFINFNEAEKASESCYGIDYCYSSYPFDCGRISLWSGVDWDNSDRKGHFEWEFETVLWDLDGTLSGTGVPDSKVTPNSALYDDCTPTAEAGWNLGFDASVCTPDQNFLRVSIEDILPESLNSITMNVNNKNGNAPDEITAQVPWREKRGQKGRAWMFLAPSEVVNEIWWEGSYQTPNVTFDLRTHYDKYDVNTILKINLRNQPDYVDLGSGVALQTVPVPGVANQTQNYGWFIDDQSDLWINFVQHSGNDYSTFGWHESMKFEMYKCYWPNCEIPNFDDPAPPAEVITCMWSSPDCWPAGVVPGLDAANKENITIVHDRHVILDVANIYVDELYIEGTLEVDPASATDFNIEFHNMLINSAHGGINTFSVEQEIAIIEGQARTVNENSLPEWQFGRLIVGTEDSPFPCDKSFTFTFAGAVGSEDRHGYGAGSDSVPLGNKTIASLGRLSLVGCEVPKNYFRLAATSQIGGNTLTLTAEPTGWKVGDSIFVTGTAWSDVEAESLTITDITGTVITVAETFAFQHLGTADTDEGFGFKQAAEVGLLSKNIKIDGTSGSEGEKYGGRVLVTGAPFGEIYRQGHATIANVEFVGMGQYAMPSLWDPRHALALYGVNGQGQPRDTAVHAETGNEYQPAGYEIGATYVRGCSFHHNYGVALSANYAPNVEFSENNVFMAVDNGIAVANSFDVTINNNLVSSVVENWYYQDQYLNMHNFDIDGKYMPAGISAWEEVTFASFKRNAVYGVQGPAYEYAGEACTVDEVGATASAASIAENNYAHGSIYGIKNLFAPVDLTCTKFAGFRISRIMSHGVFAMVDAEHTIVDNVEIQDTVVGVHIYSYKPMAISHVASDDTVTFKNSIINAVTDAFSAADKGNCVDWSSEEGILKWVKSGDNHMSNMVYDRRSFEDVDAGTKEQGNKGFVFSVFQGQKHKFPHKALTIQTDNLAIYGTNYVHNVRFVNFQKEDACGKSHIAITNLKQAHDHQHQIMATEIKWSGTTSPLSKFFLNQPQLKWINPSECVDMDCDGPKKAMLVDIDGSFTGSNERSTLMGIAELGFGDNGPRGLGYFRVPAPMLTNLDGSNIAPTTFAANHGVFRSDCTLKQANNYWQCGAGDKYMQVVFESMDVDTETRRLGPITYVNNPGSPDAHVDIVNGVLDVSCCAGYSCQLRISTHPMIMSCGKTYELGTAGTISKHFRLHSNREDASCKTVLKIYTMRQNRQDVLLDGNLVLPTNGFFEADGSVGYNVADASHVPTIADPVGTNFFDRSAQILYVVHGGSSVIDVVVAKSLIVEFQSTAIELTNDQLYDSPDLINYLAALLGIDQSQIKVVNVVREGSRRRRSEDVREFTGARYRRQSDGVKLVLEILPEAVDLQATYNEQSYETSTGEKKTEVIENMASTIVKTVINNEVDPALALDQYVATTEIVEPSKPACYDGNDDLAAFEDPLYVAGDSCSLAGQLGVEPDQLSTVIDVSKLQTYDETQEDEIQALEDAESETAYRPPTQWSQRLFVATGTVNEVLAPPPTFELLDAVNDICETIQYRAEVTIKASSNPAQAFGTGSVTVVESNENNQFVFDELHFDADGDVELEFNLIEPSSSGLPSYSAPVVTIEAKNGVLCQNASCTEQACNFYQDKIECIDTNFGTSTSMLLDTMQNMTASELGNIKWLVINQNDGINKDDLVSIMALLVNLERLSLNSNNMWELDADTFNVHTMLKSISLHNNNFLCLNGALDTLIDMNILERLRLTGNTEIIDNKGGDLRYRGHAELVQFKAISDQLVCV